jgi:hypothetical protein
VAIDGDVVLYADGTEEVRAAIDRARDGEHLTTEQFEAGLEGTPEDALVRAYASPEPYLALPELRNLEQLPWAAALRSFGASVSFEDSETRVDALAATDPAGLSEADLPLAPESGEPGLVRREGEVASGSIDQSYTTAFLLRAARAVFADSRFVRDVARIEADLGIDFEQEVLRQFAGPSASSITFDGRFAARSTVADPEAMRTLLPKLAPRLPLLVSDLDSLGREGLLALLFIAPDAPVATTPTGGAPLAAEAAKPRDSSKREQLYVIQAPRGPRGTIPIAELPERIVFGMVGDVFVVASNHNRALEIAESEPEPAGLSGASVIEAEGLGDIPARIGTFLDLDVSEIKTFEGTIDASLEAIRAEFALGY